MNAYDPESVWTSLNRDWLSAIARSGPTPLFATISGAHLYGFASPDSDVDLRGAFVVPARDLLGLSQPKETLSIEEVRDGVELDWVAHDIRKFARMMTQHNGYVLEQLFSPLVVIGDDQHDELKQIGHGCVTRGIFRHYRGFAHGRRKLLSEPNPTVKHLLYAYRVYLTGIRALRTGQIEANVCILNQEFRLPQIDELVARKSTGKEKTLLAADELQQHNSDLDDLEKQLLAAYEQSQLPEEATSRQALDDFVVRVRLKQTDP